MVAGCGRKAQKWVAYQEWVAAGIAYTVLGWSKCIRVFAVPNGVGGVVVEGLTHVASKAHDATAL